MVRPIWTQEFKQITETPGGFKIISLHFQPEFSKIFEVLEFFCGSCLSVRLRTFSEEYSVQVEILPTNFAMKKQLIVEENLKKIQKFAEPLIQNSLELQNETDECHCLTLFSAPGDPFRAAKLRWQTTGPELRLSQDQRQELPREM